MEVYRYQQLAYLVVPIMLGIELFLCAKDEKGEADSTPLGSYVLDFLGFLFIALIPAIFIFTIWAVETKAFSFQAQTFARFDRYAVLFLFLGAWWQVHMYGALRARRMKMKAHSGRFLWIPFLMLGTLISVLILWDSPFALKWISLGWFLLLSGILGLAKVRPKRVELVLWILAATAFLVENLVFIFLETVI